MDWQQFESACEIMSESRIDGLRVMFGFKLSFIDANEFLPFPRLFSKAVVSNPVKPGRETRFAAKAAEVFVCLEKGLLGQIIRERDIRPNQVAEQTSHARLMISDQLRKGVVVVVNKNARNEVCIG